MKKILTFCTVLTLALAVAITMAACGKSGGTTTGKDTGTGGGGDMSSVVTGPRYVYMRDNFGSGTNLTYNTLIFDGGTTISSTGSGIAHVEGVGKTSKSHMSCTFTYTSTGTTVTINWKSGIGDWSTDNPTTEQGTAAAINALVSLSDFGQLSIPRTFSIEGGNVVAKLGAQSFVFEKKQ